MKTIFSILLMTAISIASYAHGAELTLNFLTKINGSALQYNADHIVNGTKINVEHLGYYITNIRLVKTDNSETVIDTVLLVKGSETFTFDKSANNGVYKAVTFDVGIADSSVNHGDPVLYPANHPLALQTPSMHWSWNSGYIFFKLDGQADTSANNQHGVTEALTFHLGMLSSVRTVTLNENFSFNGTHSNPDIFEIDVVLNLENVFTGIDLKTDRVTMTMNNPTLATQACDNLQNAFELSVRNVTGIAEKNAFQRNVKLYPNPAEQMLTIETSAIEKNVVLHITDLSGRIVLKTEMFDNKTQVNIESLERGVYFVKQQGRSGAVRFVKF